VTAKVPPAAETNEVTSKRALYAATPPQSLLLSIPKIGWIHCETKFPTPVTLPETAEPLKVVVGVLGQPVPVAPLVATS
jgi:hypothetical protein